MKKRKPSKIKVPKKFEDMLWMLREFLNKSDDSEAWLMWQVLTALRGPDGPSSKKKSELKRATTAVIRYVVLGNNSYTYGLTGPDNQDFAKKRIELLRSALKHQSPNHFLDHAMQAFEALGLSWRMENSRVGPGQDWTVNVKDATRPKGKGIA